MVSCAGLTVWLGLLVTCAVCLKWSTDASSQKQERILSCIGLVAGLVAFWMIIIVVLTDTHSILGYVFWAIVAVAGTWFFAQTIDQAMSTTRTAHPEGDE